MRIKHVNQPKYQNPTVTWKQFSLEDHRSLKHVGQKYEKYMRIQHLFGGIFSPFNGSA